MDFEIKTVSIDNKDYPKKLKTIKTAPKLLYYCGVLPSDAEIGIAIVGSRIASIYGVRVCKEIGNDIANSNATIISGLAKGIDSIAHECAVSKGKRTIAVLGSGIDKSSLYPKENIRLAQEIIANGGLIISEYPPQSKPTRYSFPDRNRIIAGLSEAVLVIEARMKSGSLITADYAKNQGKKLFAVPNSIHDKNSEGTNSLIKNGANLTTCAQDIFEILKRNDLPLIYKSDKKIEVDGDNENENHILKILKEAQSPVAMERIIKVSKLSPSDTIATITILEIKDKIIDIKDHNYLIK
ncbi:DNA-processing protein DprA [bacterium]|nr:DNA-processing protein DprA [bacterium]